MGEPATVLEESDDRPREDHIVHLDGATWDDYERLLAIRGERAVPRITFLEGWLEIMTPSIDHERYKSVIGRLVEVWCLEHNVRFSSVGSWTIKDPHEERGAEPDECYIFGPVRKPRPDLAIEVVWTSGGINKLEVYRKLGVTEVWYWRRGEIEVYVLRNGQYEREPESRVLAGIDLSELVTFVDRPTTFDAIQDYREALRSKTR